MDINLTFEERASKGKEILLKQPPVTLEQALNQVKNLRKKSSVATTNRKQKKSRD